MGERFVGELKSAGVEFFAGVPDLQLKSFCAYVTALLRREPHDYREWKTAPLEVEVGGKKVFSLRWLNILR